MFFTVTEQPIELEPVEHDPFIDDLTSPRSPSTPRPPAPPRRRIVD